MSNILFTCAGRRNYLINFFKDSLNGDGAIFASDMELNAPALVDADVAIRVPPIYNENYIDTLLKIVESNEIDALISLNDLELPILSSNREKFNKVGALAIVSSEKVIEICFDKWMTYNFLKNNKIKTPQTFIDIEVAKNAILNNEIEFPIVLKPRWGSASIGIEFAKNMEEFELIYKLLRIKLSSSILSTASEKDENHNILIQEKISGIEYGMDILNDFDGNYYDSFVRQKISMRSGETDKATSIINDKFSNVGKQIGTILSHVGNLDCDIFENENGIYVLELNPRFGGGYPFSHRAGINTPGIYLDWLNGIKDVSHRNKYRENVTSAKCDYLIDISGY